MHVAYDSARLSRRLGGVLDRLTKEGERAGTAAGNGIAHRHVGRHTRVRREAVVGGSLWRVSPLFLSWKAQAMMQGGLGGTRHTGWKSGALSEGGYGLVAHGKVHMPRARR